MKWDVSKGDLGPVLQRFPLLPDPQPRGLLPPPIRSLDCFPGSAVFMAGTPGAVTGIAFSEEDVVVVLLISYLSAR